MTSYSTMIDERLASLDERLAEGKIDAYRILDTGLTGPFSYDEYGRGSLILLAGLIDAMPDASDVEWHQQVAA